jgi:hypothetical protein
MNTQKHELSTLLKLAFKAIGLAMSVAVIVLNTLGSTTVETQVILLAIGLFGLAMSAM